MHDESKNDRLQLADDGRGMADHESQITNDTQMARQ